MPEARTKIRVIQAAQEWDAIKDSENVDTIKNYIKKYPYEAQTPRAKKLVHELKGYEYYKNNDLLSAYDEFSQISINDIDSSRKYAYKASKEYYEKTGIQVGFKPAGGLNSVTDALIYYSIVKEVLGEKWLTHDHFRLGTSRLTNLLISEIIGEEVKFF